MYSHDSQYILQVLRLGSGNEGEKGVLAGLVELGIRAPRARVRNLPWKILILGDIDGFFRMITFRMPAIRIKQRQ